MSENNISTCNSNCEHRNTLLCENVPCLCTNSLQQKNNEISVDVNTNSTVVVNSVTVSELETELEEDELINVSKTELQEDDLNIVSKTELQEDDLNIVSKTELQEDDLINVSKWNICLIIISLAMYMADVFSDIILAITYIWNKEVLFFCLTAGFVYFHSAVITLYSRLDSAKWKKSMLMCLIIFLFNLEPVLCYISILYYIIQITKTDQRENKINLYEKMVEKQEDVALMKFLEGFYESAPQLILQIAIMYNILEKADETAKISMFQYISIITSILGLTTTVFSYFKIQIFDKPKETSVTISAARITLLLLWIFPIVVSRILSMSFLFLKHPYRLLLGLLINFILFNIYLISTGMEKGDASGVSLLLSFIPFSPHEEVISLSLPYFICFHSVHFVENVLSCVQWMYDMKCQLNNFHIYLAIINIVFFVIGFTFGLIFIKMKKRLNIRLYKRWRI